MMKTAVKHLVMRTVSHKHTRTHMQTSTHAKIAAQALANIHPHINTHKLMRDTCKLALWLCKYQGYDLHISHQHIYLVYLYVCTHTSHK